MERITNIPISLLEAHPKNPRQDLGDLSELAASIKEKGILQNLTVVKKKQDGNWHGKYTIIIGHRRCAAAKEAGIKELPCAVVEMSEREQLATMMLENVQRNDLTPYEQACGYQMMLDVGIALKEISQQTGVSESTIRRRIKLTELDAEKLKKAQTRQISFDELDRIATIKDVKQRNRVLEKFGTRDYNAEFDKVMTAQKEAELYDFFRKVLTEKGAIEKYGSEIRFSNVYKSIAQTRCDKMDPEELTEKMLDGVQYYFFFDYGWCYLRVKQEQMNISTNEAPAAKAEKERKKQLAEEKKKNLAEATKRAYRLRTMFIVTRTNAKCGDKVNDIVMFLTQQLWTYGSVGGNYAVDRMYPYTGGMYDTKQEGAKAMWEYHAAAYTLRTLFYDACAIIGDNENMGFVSWDGQYSKNPRLLEFYEFLEKMGYTMSTEESQLADGTSPLFKTEEE